MREWFKNHIDKILNRIVGISFVIFLIGVIIPVISLSLDRHSPIVVSHPVICPGEPGKLTCISANIETDNTRRCGVTLNPIFVGSDGQVAAVNSARFYNADVLYLRDIYSPGVFKSQITIPPNMRPGKAKLNVEMQVSCEDNFTQKIVPISQNIIFDLEVMASEQ